MVAWGLQHDDEVGLADLQSVDDHLHGELVIEVNDVVVTGMGFFGASDVCIGDWVAFLVAAAPRLHEREQVAVAFDDFEQGQPAFVFERNGRTLTVSIADSESGLGPADPTWVPQTCSFDDFNDGVGTFLACVRETLQQFAPTVGEAWLESKIHRGQAELCERRDDRE